MKYTPVAILMAFLSSLPASAEEAETRLDPVVVTAVRAELTPIPTAGSLTVITRGEIEACGAQHIAEVLRGRGGIQIADQFGDGSRATVSMRGFGANAQANSLILIDGRRLNNTDLGAPDLNSIPLQDVERIEIIQGSAGALYGDQAVGGVINIITRRPRDLAGSLELGFGGYGWQAQRLQGGARHETGLFARVSGERRASDNYRDNNEQRYRNGLLHLGWEGERTLVFAEHQVVDEELELPGALFAGELAANRRRSRFPGDFIDTDTHTTRLGLRQDVTSRWVLHAEATQRRSKAQGRLTGIDLDQQRRARALNPRIVGRLPLAGGDAVLTAGADLEHTDYRLASIFGVTYSEQSMHSLYAQVVLPLTSTVAITAGARQAWMRKDLLDSFAFPAGTRHRDQVTAGSLGLSFTPREGWRLFLRRDDNYRFPLADELTFAVPEALSTQTGVSYEAGAEWQQGGHRFKALGYRLKLDDEIDFDPSAGFFGANTNLDPSERSGVILEAAAALGPQLTVSGQYSWVEARFDSGAFAGNRIPFVAEHQGRLAMDLRLMDSLLLYGELQAIGERVASGDFANALERLPGYALVNLHLSYRLRGFGLAARVNNLLDKRYSDFAATAFNVATFSQETGFFPAPERNLQLLLSYAFD